MRRLAILALTAALLAQEAEGPAQSRLDEKNQKAAEKVYRTVAREGGDITNRLRGLRKEDVIVVGGLFDFVQEVLVAFRCPHTIITPAELEHHKLEPVERKIFLLNCHLMQRDFPASSPARERPSARDAAARLAHVLKEAGLDGDTAPGKAIRERFKEVALFAGSRYSVAGLRRMGAAVKGGAWIYSTDWAVLALERALPGTIRWTGRSTYEETIEVRPSLIGRRHALLKGVFEQKSAKWWLETEAYLFSMKGRYKVLIESRALAARYHGNKNVVVLIEPKKGRVLHALSHGYLQRGKTDDITSMQRLLLNYLVEKSLQNHRRVLAAKKKQEQK